MKQEGQRSDLSTWLVMMTSSHLVLPPCVGYLLLSQLSKCNPPNVGDNLSLSPGKTVDISLSLEIKKMILKPIMTY